MTAIDTFDKQDIFLDRMIEDYKKGVIPHASVFAPYFRWKMGECGHDAITRETAYEMLGEASALLEGYYDKYPKAYENMDSYIDGDPWQQYKGFGDTNMSCLILKALTANCKISLPFCSKDSSAELQKQCLWIVAFIHHNQILNFLRPIFINLGRHTQ